jgi:hypothetical protein
VQLSVIPVALVPLVTHEAARHKDTIYSIGGQCDNWTQPARQLAKTNREQRRAVVTQWYGITAACMPVLWDGISE